MEVLIYVLVLGALAYVGVKVFQRAAQGRATPDDPSPTPDAGQKDTSAASDVTDAPGGRPAGPSAEAQGPRDTGESGRGQGAG